METKAIFEALRAELGDDAATDLHDDPAKDKDPWFVVPGARLVEVTTKLKSDPRFSFDWLENLTGVDYPAEKKIRVVYHLFSYSLRHRVVLKVELDREAPKVATLASVWAVAGWHERECYDLLGVDFEGHRDLRRLLLPDDWVGHPLRKDYAEQASYGGIPTTRPNPLDLLQIGKAPAKTEAAS